MLQCHRAHPKGYLNFDDLSGKDECSERADWELDDIIEVCGWQETNFESHRQPPRQPPVRFPSSVLPDSKDLSLDATIVSDEQSSEDNIKYTNACNKCFCLRFCFLIIAFAGMFSAGLTLGMRLKDKKGHLITSRSSVAPGLNTTNNNNDNNNNSNNGSAPPTPFPTPGVPTGFQPSIGSNYLSTITPTRGLVTSNPITTPFNHDSTSMPSWTPVSSPTSTPVHIVTVSGYSPTQPQSQSSSSNPMVGVYYYPWYGSNFHDHGGYLRKFLDPRQYPTLGEYDDSFPSTISQHLAWSRQANIGLWVTSWWGPNRLEDSNTKNVILASPDLGDMKIALHYESLGRIKQNSSGVYSTDNASTDLAYICANYFDHPNYFYIDGRPVIFLYAARVLNSGGVLGQVVTNMRTAAANSCGKDIFIVGDAAFWDPPAVGTAYQSFLFYDAITNYDMYGSMMRGSGALYATSSRVDAFFADQTNWKARALEQGCRFIPSISPGFNDRGVRLQANYRALSRQLSSTSEEGSLFQYALSKGLTLVDSQVQNLLMVNSWNEWHEDSQIEPCVGNTTSLPVNYTNGVTYRGYGELYLNLLRQATVSNIFSR